MRFDGLESFIRDILNEKRPTRVGGWGNLWAHCGGRGIIRNSTRRHLVNFSWLRAEKDAVYQSRVTQYLASYDVPLGMPPMDISLCKFWWPFDALCYVGAMWSRDIVQEVRFRLPLQTKAAFQP